MKRAKLFFLLFVLPVLAGTFFALWQSETVDQVTGWLDGQADTLLDQAEAILRQLRRSGRA